jgi:hypothetical protein
MVEPFRLKAWRLAGPSSEFFYTCARPGRSRGSKAKVPDCLVLDWARGLPGGTEICIISLLGQKPAGPSEFSFYPSFDDAESFQEWLNASVTGRKFRIISHPTTDLEEIDPAVLAAVAADVRRLVSEGKTVVIMDSGGWTRTGAVAACLGAASMTVSSLGLDAE